MALHSSRLAACAAALAATSMLAMPSAAAELPRIPSNLPAHATSHDGSAETADGWRRRHHRRGVDAGDVIAGVVVLGAIAAIASSASSSRDRDRRREDVRYREPAPRQASWGSGGIDRAVDMCVNQVERGRDRVDSVDNASRDARGWNVSGSLSNGEYFNCRIDNEGRIRSIDLGDNFSSYDGAGAQAGPQWSDQDYAAARASVRGQAVEPGYDGSIDADLDGPRPAYPGGPLPGEEGYEESFGG